jgi:hypothetical protein
MMKKHCVAGMDDFAALRPDHRAGGEPSELLEGPESASGVMEGSGMARGRTLTGASEV